MSGYGNLSGFPPQPLNASFSPLPVPQPVGYGVLDASQLRAASPVAVEEQQGFEEVVVRVPRREQVRVVQAPPQYRDVAVAGPPRVRIVREVIPGPVRTVQEMVPGPIEYRDERVEVPGPVVERIERVEIPAPEQTRVVREVIPGPEIVREVKVEVPGPIREKVREVPVPGPVIQKRIEVPVDVPGPVHYKDIPVDVPRDVVREVVRANPMQRLRPVPVYQPGPIREVVVAEHDRQTMWENHMMRMEVEWLKRSLIRPPKARVVGVRQLPPQFTQGLGAPVMAPQFAQGGPVQVVTQPTMGQVQLATVGAPVLQPQMSFAQSVPLGVPTGGSAYGAVYHQ